MTETKKTIVSKHDNNYRSYVLEDGTAKLSCVMKHEPCGCEIIGDGSCPHPLTIKRCEKHGDDSPAIKLLRELLSLGTDENVGSHFTDNNGWKPTLTVNYYERVRELVEPAPKRIGREAFEQGVPDLDNPYKSGTQAAEDWSRGWNEALAEQSETPTATLYEELEREVTDPESGRRWRIVRDPSRDDRPDLRQRWGHCIRFYDLDSKDFHGKKLDGGQFVSSYYSHSLLNHPANVGLNLHGGVEAWGVSYAVVKLAQEMARFGLQATRPSYSVTYETWDEEAIEAGDTDDKGFEQEDVSLVPDKHDRDAAEEQDLDPVVFLAETALLDLGATVPSTSPPSGACWYSTPDGEKNYRTGEVTNRSVHFKNLTDEQWEQLHAAMKNR